MLEEIEKYYQALQRVASAEIALQQAHAAVLPTLNLLYQKMASALFPGKNVGILNGYCEGSWRQGYISLYGKQVIHIPLSVLKENKLDEWIKEQTIEQDKVRAAAEEAEVARKEGRMRIFRGEAL